MHTSGLKQVALSMYGRFIAIALIALFFTNSSYAQSAAKPTTINIADTAKLTGARRLGINLGTQNFWDSGMFMRNLSFRNPGFEGETWQSIIHCQFVTSNTCTDDNPWTYWPSNFLSGSSVEFIVGGATGATGNVTSSTAATIGVVGVTLTFSGLSKSPSVGDYLVVRKHIAGNANAGWWTASTGGATFSTELSDLSPNTPGKQALRMTAGSGQTATLSSYMDSTSGKSFIQLNGTYTISFRAKGTGGANKVNVSLIRAVTTPPALSFFNKDVTLTNSWQDYSFTFQPKDTGQVGTISLSFALNGSSMLVDDVALTAAAGADNPTVYRDEVVSTLKALKPGTLRYMDSGTNWGSSIDNMLAPDFARERAGYTNRNSEADDIPLGLHDYLVLCQTIGAEPWYTMQTGMSTQEMSNLMDYLGGSTSTVYGAKRAAMGQVSPWSTVFSTIHLEFGNEVWNTSNPGASMNDATSYGKRAGVIFGTAKASPSYSAKSFDFILGGFEAVPYWTQQSLAGASNYDTVDTASYFFGSYNDASSTESTFGAMFAQPESTVAVSTGYMAQQAAAAANAHTPAKVAVYETNIGTIAGAASQAQVNAAIPSLGAGLTVAENMLIAQRDLGVNNQNMFALEGYNAPFSGTAGSSATTSPIWGVTIDMGGPTNRVRPMYLSEKLANSAILPTLLSTSQTGANPTWNQAYTTNDYFSMTGAHYIQSMAYTDGKTLNVILFNLSRTTALPVNFAGLNTPTGLATLNTLTAARIDATNETAENVGITTSSQNLDANTVLTLPPFSMTVVSVAAPVVPIAINSVTTSCSNASLSPNDSTTCSAKVVGQGKYNSQVTWSATNGSISSDGIYTAPSSVPPNKKAVITATSVGDTKQSSKFTISLADNTITGVTATCAATKIGQGNSLTCAATVTGTGSFSPGYAWTTTGGTISSIGTLTAPTTGTSVTVTATSTQDSSKSASVTLTVYPVLVMGTPTSSTTGTTATVNWSVNMPAYSGITFGATTALGTSTPYIASTSTNPSITLTGLKPSTTYYLVVYSYLNGQSATKSYTLTTSDGSTSVTGVSVACAASSVKASGSTTCSAAVQGNGKFSSAVTWSTSAGSITSAGVLTAPSTGTSVTITATSTTDSTKSGSKTISIASTITGITVSCQATSIAAGGATSCSPTVTGTGAFSSGVAWSTSAGTITSTGVVTAPATGTSLVVTATSIQDSTKSASTTISLNPSAAITGITASCQTSSLATGGSTSCAASVTGTGSYSSAVTWSTTGGSINSSGQLTAPASGSSVTVTAKSNQDPTKTASFTIALNATLSISDPIATSTSNSVTVHWTVSTAAYNGVSYGAAPNYGVTTPYTGVTSTNASFTLPNLQPSTAVAVMVFSYINGQSVSKTITIMTQAAPKVSSVSVSCGASTLLPSASTACTSAVKGTGSFSSDVIWSASAGSISTAGAFTAPAAGTAVTVKATSVQDPTIFAVATIAISEDLAIVNPIISASPTTIVVSWKVTKPAHNGVDYGSTKGYGATTPYQFQKSTAPTFTFTGLKPGTTYYGYIFSFDDAGKTVGQAITMTTPLQ